MKITKYPREERQFKDLGFIQIYFSFRPDFRIKKRHNFGILFNLDDASMPPNSRGFGMHPHQDLEVVTLFLEGQGHHEDNHGNVGVTSAKAVQLITAGTGIMHEEYNFSKDLPFKAIQMFLHPEIVGIQPNYQKIELKPEQYEGKLVQLISPTGKNGTLKIANQSYFSYGILEDGSNISYEVNQPDNNGVFVKIINGEAEINGVNLREKDEIGLEEVKHVMINCISKTEIMIFEVPLKL